MSKQVVRPTVGSWLIKASRHTSLSNPNAPYEIIGHVLKLSKEQILGSASSQKLTTLQKRKLDNLLGQLLSGKPLAAVIGKTTFHSVELKVNTHTLSPRAETEKLVEYATKHLPKSSYLYDIGCGTGAIGLAIAKKRKDVIVHLSDINPRSVRLAKQNAHLNNIKAHFSRSDLLRGLSIAKPETSFYIANLPYVDKNWPHADLKKLAKEPAQALYSKAAGLAHIKTLLKQLKKRELLLSSNWLLLEHDPLQKSELQKYCHKLGYKLEELSPYCSKITISK